MKFVNSKRCEIYPGLNKILIRSKNGKVFTGVSHNQKSNSSSLKEDSFLSQNSTIKTVQGNHNGFFFLTKNGKVFGTGKNGFGIFGRELNSSENTPKNQFVEIKVLKERKVVKLFLGFSSLIFVMENGQNYYYGSQTGTIVSRIKSNPLQEPKEVMIKDLQKGEIIEDVKSGFCSDFILTNKGNVYSNGTGKALGYEENKKDSRFFNKIDFSDNHDDKKRIKIIQVAPGYYHTLFLTSNHEVYGCGSNFHSELGFKARVDIVEPIPLSLFIPKRVIKIQCASKTSFFITKEKDEIKIFTSGVNWFGQAAVLDQNGKIKERNDVPTEITFFGKEPDDLHYKFIDVYCSDETSFFVNKFGEIYACGQNIDGKCYLSGRNEAKIITPTKIEGIELKVSNKKRLKEFFVLNKRKELLANITIKTET